MRCLLLFGPRSPCTDPSMPTPSTAGLDVGDEHADADLASLLGPIAADVRGMLDSPPTPQQQQQQQQQPLPLSGGSPARVLPLGAEMPARPASAPLHNAAQQQLLGSLVLQPSAEASAVHQQLAASGSTGHLAAAQQQHAVQQPHEGGLLAALAQWTTFS